MTRNAALETLGLDAQAISKLEAKIESGNGTPDDQIILNDINFMVNAMQHKGDKREALEAFVLDTEAERAADYADQAA